MKIFRQLIVGVSLWLCHSVAHACMPMPPNPSHEAALAKSIAVVRVTGERSISFWDALLAGQWPFGEKQRIVTVSLVKALKGNPPRTQEFNSECNGPFPELGQKVIAIQRESFAYARELRFENQLVAAMRSAR